MGWLSTGGVVDGSGAVATAWRRGAKAKITADNAILLVRERHTDGTPFWTLPGGGVRSNESLVTGLYRELHEELGFDDVEVCVGDRVGQLWYAHRTGTQCSCYAIFDCSIGALPRPNVHEGVLEARWFKPDTLPSSTLPGIHTLF